MEQQKLSHEEIDTLVKAFKEVASSISKSHGYWSSSKPPAVKGTLLTDVYEYTEETTLERLGDKHKVPKEFLFHA